MPSDLTDLRAAFEHQISMFGDLVYPDAAPASATETQPEPTKEENPLTTDQAPIEPPPNEAAAPSETAAPPEAAAPPETAGDVYENIAALIPTDSPMVSMKSLDEVSAYVAATELIELDKTRLNPVFGVGNPKADLMVIGEAPGADEDKQGEPFVGRAGKLLTQILEAIGFPRTEVYIANILKSRPPNNREPLKEEIAAHIPILHKQIALIQPKLILCVGRTSGTSLLGIQSSLKDMRGTFHDYHGIPVMVTYHPAALLRNPNWKRPTWEDVQVLRSRYDELTA